MSKQITQAALAKKWNLGRTRITQYKQEGMPVNSESSAFAWLSTHYPERAATITQDQPEPPEQKAPLPQEPSKQETKSKGLAVVVARAAKNEVVAWRMLEHAIQNNQTANIISLTKHYDAACRSRLAIEKEFAEFRIKSGELVTVTEVAELLGKIFAPIKSQLTALPYSCSARANPTDPEHAREAITAECEKMKEQIRKALEELK